MALTFTYATLKTALQSFTEDSGSEFVTALDTIIPLGETRLVKDLDLEIFDVVTTGTFTIGNPLVAKPSSMVALRTFHYTDATGNFQPLDPKTWDYIKDYWPKSSTTTATPKYYAEYDESNWYLAGTPSLGSTYTVRYIKRPAGLSGSVSTTWLSTNAADALLYACLISCEQFLKADDRISLWKQEYATHLQTARTELRRTDRNDYSPVNAAPDAS